jgi:hypothetical protein
MTHAELVARAQRWLRTTRKHAVVLAEIGTAGYECPDVIGWTGGWSTLIECKVSVADFRADAAKPFRRDPARGMGYFRWYAFPQSLVHVDQTRFGVPDGWGVVLFTASRARVMVKPKGFLVRNERSETALLVSALRRATEGWGRKVFGDISPAHGTLDPHPSINATLKSYQAELRSARAQRDELGERLSVASRRLMDAQEQVRALTFPTRVAELEKKIDAIDTSILPVPSRRTE